MGWVIYQTSFGANNNGWHYASIGGTYNGLTTGLNASGTSLTFYGFNSQAGGGFDQKPVFYIQNTPIKFSNKKNYLFETAITNFESSNVQNKITIKLSHFSPGGVDGWQGRSKYIEYGTPQGTLYPPGNTRTSAVGNDVSTTKTLIYQFFSKPTETFFSPQITESYSSLINGKYAIAEFLATKRFGDKSAQVTDQTRTYPNSPTNNDMCLLKNFSISELDFQVQGWAVYKEENYLTDLAIDEVEAIGWAYFNGTYSWRVSSTQSGVRLNAMGPVPDSGTYSAQVFNDSEADMVIASNTWTVNNFIGLPIEDGQIFNIQFDVIFSTQSGPNLGPDLKLYLSNELPTKYTVTPQRGLLVGTFTESNRYYYYNLNGGRYLYFVGGTAGTTGLNFVDIGNISIRQGYSLTNNNKQFAFQSELSPYSEPTQLSILGADPESTYSSISITDTTVHETDNGFVGPKKLTYTPPTVSPVRAAANPTTTLQPLPGGGFTMVTIPLLTVNTAPQLSGFSTVGFFSNVFGTVSNLTEIRSKVGNGTFKAGVWENGVWNSGWRVDQNVHEFNDISLSFNLKTENVRWRIQIEGPTYSVANFEIGDRISIGNIVTIDINEKRKLLKNYFTIVNKNETTLIVEVDNVFPIRRIQKDSPNHKILITKNVWLNGGFLNGYFEGIWNDGLFKGYPYITEMYNSHWIDGKFDGGHFYATKPSFKFEDTYYWEGYVGLTFGSVTHSYLPGDLITINKDDKSVNPQYDGDHKITKIVDEHLVVTDIQWGENTSNETGTVTRRTSTGLIQNFKFYDNNKSTKTSRDSRVLKDLWRYCSWIDVNYSNQSTTNINSDRIYNNKSTTNFLYWRDRHQFGIGDYAVLNLYGFITEDVLSSESYFRGLDSVSRRPYSLGTKYEIYQDFLGDISNFNSPFDTDPELGTLDNFFADGWTWSFSGTDGGTYSYVNNLVTKANSSFIKRTDVRTSDPQAPTQLYGGNPTWSLVPFQTTIEDTFGLLITASTSNNEWTVNTNGIYNINIEIPSNFTTEVLATPLESGIDNDYLFLTGNVTVGQLRLVKYSNGTTSVLSSKTIKTTGGDFNVGTDRYDEGQNFASYSKDLTLFIDWKGNLQIGDKVRLEFQSCQLAITNYNAGGPWRGSGFEQGFPLYDNIIYVKADWLFNSSRTLSISNAGVNNSLGFNMRRTSDGTLLVEHLENSYHSITLNNSNIKIAKNRYSMIEFDLIQAPETSYQPLGESYSFHWTDLYNFTTFINRDLSYSNQPAFPGVEILDDINIGGTLSVIRQNPTSKRALWSGIDYTKTIDTKKREFFYNRPGLDLGLLAEQRESFREQIHELDNIKFYEVDMIPFFQYTTEEYVDSGIKIPYQGKAPFIDYTNSDFSFVESVVIGLDSVDLQETSTTYVPQGITPFIFTPPPPPSFTLTPLSGINSNSPAGQ